jgi:hypothetical protein
VAPPRLLGDGNGGLPTGRESPVDEQKEVDIMDISAHISKRSSIEPRRAADAVATWSRNNRHVSLRAARLRLASTPEPTSNDPLQLAEVRGILWLSGWPVRVRLECRVWSDSEVEFSLRSTNLRWPVGTVRYVRAATMLLELVDRAAQTVGVATVQTRATLVELQLPVAA